MLSGESVARHTGDAGRFRASGHRFRSCAQWTWTRFARRRRARVSRCSDRLPTRHGAQRCSGRVTGHMLNVRSSGGPLPAGYAAEASRQGRMRFRLDDAVVVRPAQLLQCQNSGGWDLAHRGCELPSPASRRFSSRAAGGMWPQARGWRMTNRAGTLRAFRTPGRSGCC
jgi:hypothetical protein